MSEPHTWSFSPTRTQVSAAARATPGSQNTAVQQRQPCCYDDTGSTLTVFIDPAPFRITTPTDLVEKKYEILIMLRFIWMLSCADRILSRPPLWGRSIINSRGVVGLQHGDIPDHSIGSVQASLSTLSFEYSKQENTSLSQFVYLVMLKIMAKKCRTLRRWWKKNAKCCKKKCLWYQHPSFILNVNVI